MKKFNNVDDAMNWASKIIQKGIISGQEALAEQIYKDSNDITYRESGDMYKSGELHSKFKDGVIVERTPYVRRRYYEGGKAGAGNRKAQPRWFEKTVSKYKKDYQKLIVNSINLAKKG